MTKKTPKKKVQEAEDSLYEAVCLHGIASSWNHILRAARKYTRAYDAAKGKKS